MPATARILLTHTPEARGLYYGTHALAGLRQLGEVVLHEGPEPLNTAALIEAARCCPIIVADRATACPAELFAALPELVSVSRVAIDIRNIDVQAASAHGVLVTNASRSWVDAVSELSIGLMIDVARGVSRADAASKAGKVPAIGMGRQLAGSTVGIIGYGFLGRRVAELARAFGMQVLISDPYVQVDRSDVEQVAIDDLLRRSDFVLPLAVATDETENLIGTAQLALMPPHAYLVNLSRGNLVDEAALAAALNEKRIAGAALDVGRAPDQMPSPHLARRPDVVATPHIGGLTQPAIEGQALETVTQVGQIVRGLAPEGSVNAERAERLRRFAG
ncbi:MAG TPA: NAD(P)-dependent oxidoreductase [Hyphomicrobiaceae bacterium]|nr:NAD(P)-dependent oxidoreductase [Hyphomicrobiaceae bacterium]